MIQIGAWMQNMTRCVKMAVMVILAATALFAGITTFPANANETPSPLNKISRSDFDYTEPCVEIEVKPDLIDDVNYVAINSTHQEGDQVVLNTTIVMPLVFDARFNATGDVSGISIYSMQLLGEAYHSDRIVLVYTSFGMVIPTLLTLNSSHLHESRDVSFKLTSIDNGTYDGWNLLMGGITTIIWYVRISTLIWLPIQQVKSFVSERYMFQFTANVSSIYPIITGGDPPLGGGGSGESAGFPIVFVVLPAVGLGICFLLLKFRKKLKI